MRERLDIPDGLDGRVWRYRPGGGRRVEHRHDELEFNLVVTGRARYLVDRKRIDLAPRSQAWLFPACDHLLLNETGDFRMWVAVFRPALVRRVCAGDADRPLARPRPDAATPVLRDLPVAAADKLDRLCQETIDADQATDVALCNATLALLLLSAWRAHRSAVAPAVAGVDVHPAVEHAARRLRDDDAALALSLDELADDAGLSASRLSRLFKRQTGVSLTDYRNRVRIERFLRLYDDGQRITMLHGALAAGFGSYAQFYRVFTAVTGKTPARYRTYNPTNHPLC